MSDTLLGPPAVCTNLGRAFLPSCKTRSLEKKRVTLFSLLWYTTRNAYLNVNSRCEAAPRVRSLCVDFQVSVSQNIWRERSDTSVFASHQSCAISNTVVFKTSHSPVISRCVLGCLSLCVLSGSVEKAFSMLKIIGYQSRFGRHKVRLLQQVVRRQCAGKCMFCTQVFVQCVYRVLQQ